MTRAVAELLETVVRHREVHWLAVAARRAGNTESTEERAARASTRSAATIARDRLGLLVLEDPALLGAAETAWMRVLHPARDLFGPFQAEGGELLELGGAELGSPGLGVGQEHAQLHCVFLAVDGDRFDGDVRATTACGCTRRIPVSAAAFAAP
ncbi:hypothetical protein ABZ923_31305 [Streptomyces sp. NPDC046881]|uniref:hypothetical protein n=1 Tax=Streptomyces sp. NPDC046881 TaxID=3155374 RepID=UPI0033CB358A